MLTRCQTGQIVILDFLGFMIGLKLNKTLRYNLADAIVRDCFGTKKLRSSHVILCQKICDQNSELRISEPKHLGGKVCDCPLVGGDLQFQVWRDNCNYCRPEVSRDWLNLNDRSALGRRRRKFHRGIRYGIVYIRYWEATYVLLYIVSGSLLIGHLPV